jgi:hypothetical protein
MEQEYGRCSIEGDRLYGAQIIQWRAEVRAALNPYDEAKARQILAILKTA